MGEIFADRAGDYDGSGAPITGSADVDIAYTCTPKDGGILRLYARPSGSTHSYNLVFDMRESDIKKFRANGLQYYYTWTPEIDTAVASLWD